jgi:phenylalanyl-tRNA synthetase beta chain
LPVIRVSKRELEKLLGVELSVSDIYKVLARLKCEVERVEDDEIEYEATSDRPDLYSVEGLSRAMRPWLGLSWSEFTIVRSSVKGFAENIAERPYVALAVVRNVDLSSEAVAQVMELQEKIAQTYGRSRRKISIGLYDLDQVKPPIFYKLADPDKTLFKPLGESEIMSLREALVKTEKGLIYGYLIEKMNKFPVLEDSSGRVLSLVPIINSDHCRITENSKNILIDATGTSLEDVVNAVTIMATSMVERSKERVLEEVIVNYSTGLEIIAPRRKGVLLSVSTSDINELLGTQLTVEELKHLLEKYHYYKVLQLDASTGKLVVEAPVYRVDVKSWVDVAEDVAIAYGYEKLGTEAEDFTLPSTTGRIHPVEYFSRITREIMVSLGFYEVANYMMSSKYEQLELMGAQWGMFLVENPKSERFEGVRVWLTPGLLLTLAENADKYNNLKLFEIGDVVIPDDSSETKARTERRLSMLIYYDKATLTDGLVHVKALMRELKLDVSFTKGAVPGFLPERTAVIRSCNEDIGFVGEVHPRILLSLGIKNPVVIAEISLSRILSKCLGK